MPDHGRSSRRPLAAVLVATSVALVLCATPVPARADCDANCVDCVPGPTCTACADGFRLSLVTNGCDDVNECAIGNGGCSPTATCLNTPGSFTCSCLPGFSGDGVTCTDVDECTDQTDNCDVNAGCANTNGGFTCSCHSGFSGNGVTCTDVDECQLQVDDCDPNAQCANTNGSFTCACNPGFTGDGATCTDVDECQLGASCGIGTCANTAGGYGCNCPSGVTGAFCTVNGYVPPDRKTARCENAIASKIGSYVTCVLHCRTRNATKILAGKIFDEQACTASCRADYDAKVAKLKDKGICPACLDETAQNALADDARLYAMDVKGRGFCSGATPLVP